MTLWTPGGEHPVDPPSADLPPELTADEQAQLEQMQEEMADVRAQLLAAPASVIVANHAMGIYELAAIHLTAERPQLVEAMMAIDALGALVEGLEGRLGEAEPTLREVLTQLRAAYLEVRARITDAAEPEAT
jgi:pimeloyl-ACP methyl ester carboxylesterase